MSIKQASRAEQAANINNMVASTINVYQFKSLPE